MITHACGFVQFDTEEDFNAQVSNLDGALYYVGDHIKHPNSFPAVYEYHTPWDSHFCGHWELCEDSTPMLKALAKRLEDLQKLREKIAKAIDSKQNL